MFTGIIQEIGHVSDIHGEGDGINLRIDAPRSAPDLQINESVAVNGVCLTVVGRNETSFQVQAVEETLLKSSLRHLHPGDPVNLELPVSLHQRLGGHVVLGHVDRVGIVRRIEPRSTSWMFWVEYPTDMKKYLIPVGSIAIDGVSLTVATIDRDCVGISIIPHTMENTIFRYYKPGSVVNLEFDIIGKYIIQFMELKPTENDGTKDFLTEKHLRELGF